MRTIVLLLLSAILPLPQEAGPEISPPDPPYWPPRYHVQQGGVVVIPLDPTQCYGLTLETLGRTWRCERDGRLLVGAAYNQTVGQYDLAVRTAQESEVLATVSVAEATFTRHIRPSRGRPPAETNKRKDERAEIEYALTTGEARHPMMSLRTPWQNPLETMEVGGDPYGLYRDSVVRTGKGKKRHIVDQWTTRHEGVDLRARRPTPARASGSGVVVHAKRTSKEGNMVIVYHGNSVYTLYLHLSRIAVHEGQYVEPGQQLGATGDTGAHGQPHLHYATKVGGAYVDPVAFIETINREWK